MPIPFVIANAAENFRFNSDFLNKTVSDLSPEEWLKRPGDKLNHMAWIVGHMALGRSRLMHFMGAEWTHPSSELFARGARLHPDSVYPSPEALLDIWSDAAHAMKPAFENASEKLLAEPAPQGPPSLDGTLAGMVNFMAIHETYHLGQASYLRRWLGHEGLMG